jgi:hypothetical protein
VHIAALSDGKNGCYISPKMLHSPIFRYLAWRLKLPLNDPTKTNQLYVARLLQELRTAHDVRQAVILAIDGVYDSKGQLDHQKTDFLIANDYILALAHRYPQSFKAGVSINPQRKDAIQELERCVKQGAVLVKVLPNSQEFDPANPAYIPFYQAMARLHIPLLCHVGYEFTLAGKDQSLGDPSHLKLPLDQGVTVIAAHGMSFGLFFYEKYWDTFEELVKKYPNFYWDASALSLPNRVGMLLRIRRHPDIQGRMVFGTDYPLPCFAYPALLCGHVRDYWELRKIKNRFDRHYRLLQALGLPEPTKMSTLR